MPASLLNFDLDSAAAKVAMALAYIALAMPLRLAIAAAAVSTVSTQVSATTALSSSSDSSSGAPAASCVSYIGQLVGRGPARLALPPNYAGASLSGNFYGAGGRSSTLDICLVADHETGTVGWNFTRGATDPECREPKVCKAPDCYADFAFVGLGMGTGPFDETWMGGVAAAYSILNGRFLPLFRPKQVDFEGLWLKRATI